MRAEARVFVVIESRALELAVAKREPERLDQVQLRTGVGREADHVAGVGRDLRVNEYDRWHQCCAEYVTG
jgi:hypothetical protein